jgi:hypothetical protein
MSQVLQLLSTSPTVSSCFNMESCQQYLQYFIRHTYASLS